MSKYAIWNRKDDIYTPAGAKKTAEEWIAQYGWIENPAAVPVISGGLVNGALLDELGQMKERFAAMGCQFDEGLSNEETLAVIEAFEVEMAEAAAAAALVPTAEERSAAALEAIADGQTTENAAALNALLTGEEV